MSVRHKFGRFRAKPKSKVDQALSLAKSNKKKLGSIATIVSDIPFVLVTAFNATPIVTLISAAGDGERTRITSAVVKGTIKRDVASLLIDDWRVDLVLDREPQGTALTPLLYLATATPGIGEIRNLIFKERFKILRTESGVFGESGNGVSGHVINWYVKLSLIARTKTANNWGQAEIQNNALYLVYWTTATANQPVPAFHRRLNCMDTDA